MGQRKSKIGKLLFGIIDIVIVFIFLFSVSVDVVSIPSDREGDHDDSADAAPEDTAVEELCGSICISSVSFISAKFCSGHSWCGGHTAARNDSGSICVRKNAICREESLFRTGHDRIYDTGTADLLSDLSHDVEGRADEYTVAADFTIYDKCVWHFFCSGSISCRFRTNCLNLHGWITQVH